MSYVEYKCNNFILPIQKCSQDTTTLIIPITVDTLLLIQINNKYLLYQIRTHQILLKGQLPKQFVPTHYIRSISKINNNFVYLVGNSVSICKINLKQNTTQLRQIVLPDLPFNINSISLDYKILDVSGKFILGRIQNIQDRSCTIFIYNWKNNIYSNKIILNSYFFNSIFSNITSNTFFQKQIIKSAQQIFIIVGQDNNKIHISYFNWKYIITINQQQQINKQTMEIIIKQTGKQTISTKCYPLYAFIQSPSTFVLANSQQGPTLLKINAQGNLAKQILVKIKKDQQFKGIIKSCLGIVDGNMLFSVLSLKSRVQQMYALPMNSLNQKTQNQNYLIAAPLINLQNKISSYSNCIIGSVNASIDGYSFHKYSFQQQKTVKICRKQKYDLPSQLRVQVIYRIPKIYFYYEMAEKLGFSSDYISQILQLL